MSRTAFVLGAGGAVGEAIALGLIQAGWRVTGSMRSARPGVAQRLEHAGVRVVTHDIAGDDWIGAAHGADAVVLTANLSLVARALANEALSCGKLIVFSSNNVAVDPLAPSYRELAIAEASMRTRFPGTSVIRPTLIYGDPRLQTLTRLMRLAKKLPVLPLPGNGRTRVQPIFHADLAALAVALTEPDAPQGVFAAGGPDIVSMAALYGMILGAAGSRSLVAPIPRWLLSAFAPLLALRGLLTVEQIARADLDRVAIEQDRLPSTWRPIVSLPEGLGRLYRAFG